MKQPSKTTHTDNLKKFSNHHTVSHYRLENNLQKCESYIFGKYLRAETDILDIGVGAGRTTSILSSENRRYVGIDYSEPMTSSCRIKYPNLTFHTLDAVDLSLFKDGTFDEAVFSFNGIDYIYPDKKRLKCICEVHRILRPNGVFIFSTHSSKALIIYPQLKSIDFVKKFYRLMRSFGKSILLITKQIRRKSFYSGDGYLYDPVHGGLMTHASIPKIIECELAENGFELIETISANYPTRSGVYTSPWFYYVAKKI